jgi:hypothetical protein
MPKSLGIYDLSISSVMVPKGLAAAVLASLVSQAGIASAPIIREVAFGVILFSISGVALMTFLIERGLATSFYNYIFDTQSAAPATAAGGAAPEATAGAATEPPNTDSGVDPSPVANSDT